VVVVLEEILLAAEVALVDLLQDRLLLQELEQQLLLLLVVVAVKIQIPEEELELLLLLVHL
jgi:hypothetical protein